MNFKILKTLYVGVVAIDTKDGTVTYSYAIDPFEDFAVKSLDDLESFFHRNYSNEVIPIFDRIFIGTQSYWIIRKQKDSHFYYFIQECKQWDMMLEETKEGSHLDGLTKCYTKIEIESFIANYLSSYLRYKESPFSLIMFDIDWFKKVNDTYGHLAGDYILKELASLVKIILRDSDVCGRFGGEEFTLVLPQTKLAGALKLADKVRKTIQEHTFIFQEKKIDISVSLGVTASGIHDSVFSLVDRCDNALYDAKKNGRNRIEYR